MLLAAAALIKDSAKTEFSIDGETIAAPLFRRYTGEAAGGQARGDHQSRRSSRWRRWWRRPAFR